MIFSNEDLSKKFIAAFWDAEGSVLIRKYNKHDKDNKYHSIYLYNSNKYLLNKIGKFLKYKKIKFSLIALKLRNVGDKYILGGRKVIANKVVHRISIPKSHLLIWINEIRIHLHHTKKNEVVKNILNSYGGK